MAAPNYEQIQSFDNVVNQLEQSALNEFAEYIYDGISREEVIQIAIEIAQKYSYYGAELGAQWYDLCSELAGFDLEPAELDLTSFDTLESRASTFAADAESPTLLKSAFDVFLQNEINNSIRKTGSSNLWRDYQRGLVPGKWSRVPVGNACAWCIMLASNGAWYKSKESAGALDPDHYHSDCRCKAVYHASPEDIKGYDNFSEYKHKYYEAENTRLANSRGIEPYPDELAARIQKAKEEHKAKFEAGEIDKPWTVYNEDLILMRYKYGVS